MRRHEYVLTNGIMHATPLVDVAGLAAPEDTPGAVDAAARALRQAHPESTTTADMPASPIHWQFHNRHPIE